MTEPYKIIEVKESVFADNDREAARLRTQLKQDRTFLLNLMSSPGSGKTTTLLRTLEALKDELRIGVMEADIDSDVDAKTIADAGVKSIQLHTGGMCHLDASMTEQGLKEIGTKDLDLVVLENVMNPTNIGAIFRSAAALGMDAVLLTTAGSDPLYRRASRVSMGNVFLIPWTYLPESGDWTQLLRDLGFRTVAMALHNDSVRLDDPRLAAEEKLAIVMGTEGDGLAPSTIASCDYTVRIPMYHGVDSLNVAAASAVAFYELGLPPLNEKED